MPRATRRLEERRKAERERERAEERAERRREEERERRREEEREREREEERRAEARAREREFEEAERKARERAARHRERLRAQRRAEERERVRREQARAEARRGDLERRREEERTSERAAARREAARGERREEDAQLARAEERERVRREEARAEAREGALDRRLEEERAAERDAARREAARDERREQAARDERREEARAEARQGGLERRRAEEREAERAEARREAARDERREEDALMARAEERERERREEARAEAREGGLERRREDERAREREKEGREEARQGRVEERRDEQRRADRGRAAAERAVDSRRAAARAERRGRRRREPITTGVLSGSLGWLRAKGRLLVDEAEDAVTLRGVTLRGLERAEPTAGTYDPAAEGDELDLLAAWGANVVLVPIAQDLALFGREDAGPEEYLQALDGTIQAAAAAGLYTLVQLSLLSSGVPTHPADDGDAFDPPLPDARSIDLWAALAQRYRDEPAVLFDLFRSPHAPERGDSTAELLSDLPWAVWNRWLLAMLGEVRRSHPRALVVARGLARGSDLSGFPLRYSDGTPAPNVVYGAELAGGDPTAVFRALAPLARSHPVGVFTLRAGPLDAPAVERIGEVLAAAGYHLVTAGWREADAPLVRRRSRLHPTELGNAVAKALAQPRAAEANLERPPGRSEGGGLPGALAAFRVLASLLPGAVPPARPSPPPPPPRSIYVFYGYSGAPALPPFPDGKDADQSFGLAARTLGETLRKLFPEDKVYVVQAWTKDKVVAALEGAKEPIRQVHVVTHGDSTRLSLAYHYDERFVERARRFNSAPGSDHSRAIAAMRDEDALVPGYLAFALEPDRLDRIKRNHLPGATWQIWGCFAGYPEDSFGDPSLPPDLNAYLLRFGLGLARVDGVSVDIAKRLGVTCTAAKDLPGQPARGLEFWHGTQKRTVERNTERTPARPPFWLWNVKGSVWVSYDGTGSALPLPIVLGTQRTQAELLPGKPPRWLTDAYWK